MFRFSCARSVRLCSQFISQIWHVSCSARSAWKKRGALKERTLSCSVRCPARRFGFSYSSLFLEWTERCAEEIRHVEKENENITPRASLGLQERTAFRNLLVLFVKDLERYDCVYRFLSVQYCSLSSLPHQWKSRGNKIKETRGFLEDEKQRQWMACERAEKLGKMNRGEEHKC